MDVDDTGYEFEDLVAAVRQFEDLDIFVGQRSRLHPGPGWALTLSLIRRELEVLRLDLQSRQPTSDQGPAIPR